MLTENMVELVTALGAFVGVVGISIAIWLQLVARRRCPASAIAGFYLFGAFLVFLNTGAFGVPPDAATGLAGLALLVALVAEVSAAVFVYRHFSRPCRETTADAWFDDVFGN